MLTEPEQSPICKKNVEKHKYRKSEQSPICKQHRELRQTNGMQTKHEKVLVSAGNIENVERTNTKRLLKITETYDFHIWLYLREGGCICSEDFALTNFKHYYNDNLKSFLQYLQKQK